MQQSFRDTLPPIPIGRGNQRGLSRRTVFVGGGILLALIIGGILLAVSNNGSLKDPLQRLTLRLQTLQSISNESRDIITNPDLSKINSDTSLLVTGSHASLDAPMDAAGRGNTSDANKKLEADTATLTALRDAQLRGTYDDTYARVVAQKVDTIIVLLSEIYSKTNSRSLKEALNHEYNNFVSLKKDFTNLKR